MVGDGMGLSQVTAGRTYKGSLELEKFKVVGLVLTHAYGDEYITDSAASASAMATGVLTYNGAIAVDPDGERLETSMERAQKLGKKTGVVVTCSITHATPACFVAHVPSREMESEIAAQIARSGTDLYLGGGREWFLPIGDGGRRHDGENLVEDMQTRGFSYVSTPSEFEALDLKGAKKVLGLFAENHPPEAQKRDPSLVEMTAAALEFLSASQNGFYLIVEGSQIDWAGHDHDSDQILVEVADFDDAVGEVLRFAERNPETLVIVTADHETGGYSLVDGSLEKHEVKGRFTTGSHTGTMIPLFAMGPGAERFGGIHNHAEVGRMLAEALR
jgi:alkaline phosphatase